MDARLDIGQAGAASTGAPWIIPDSDAATPAVFGSASGLAEPTAHVTTATPNLLIGKSLGRHQLSYAVVKRCMDLVLASAALVAFAPVMLLIALVNRLDSPGPVIFKQTRIGRDGHPFVIYKFRTMRPDRRRAQLPFVGPDRRIRHKDPNDPRITRVGRVLRRTSLDELPQLWNVIRGEMSLVGPRPELPEIVEWYEPWQHQRHVVRPGLTGWWQISGRSNCPMHEHTELDIYYVEHMGFRLDMLILARTVRVALSGFGAF